MEFLYLFTGVIIFASGFCLAWSFFAHRCNTLMNSLSDREHFIISLIRERPQLTNNIYQVENTSMNPTSFVPRTDEEEAKIAERLGY